MGQSSRSRIGESWPDLANHNVWLRKGLDLMSLMRRLMVLKAPECFQRIVCRDCHDLSCLSRGVDRNRVSQCVRSLFRIWCACASSCDFGLRVVDRAFPWWCERADWSSRWYDECDCGCSTNVTVNLTENEEENCFTLYKWQFPVVREAVENGYVAHVGSGHGFGTRS